MLKSGGGEIIYFEIWGGHGPPGPPGSSAYVVTGADPGINASGGHLHNNTLAHSTVTNDDDVGLHE